MDPIQQKPTEKTLEFRLGLVLSIRDQAKFMLHGLNVSGFTEERFKEETQRLKSFIEALEKTYERRNHSN